MFVGVLVDWFFGKELKWKQISYNELVARVNIIKWLPILALKKDTNKMLRGQKNIRILAGRNKAILPIAILTNAWKLKLIKFLFSSIIPVMVSFYCPIRVTSVLSFLDCVTKLRHHLPSRTKLVITRELLASSSRASSHAKVENVNTSKRVILSRSRG